MSSPKVYLTTGTSSGLGTLFVKQILDRGEQVIATARSLSKLKTALSDALGEKVAADVPTLELDVVWPAEKIKEVVEEAIKIYGRVDVLVNNAGYAETGIMEEVTPEDLRRQFDTNVFGAVNTTNAILPHLRSRRAGAIVFISSMAAYGGLSGAGPYYASKAALSSLALTYEQELSSFNIKVLAIEPGAVRTVFLSLDQRKGGSTSIPDYKELSAFVTARLDNLNGKQPGDPEKHVSTYLDLIQQKTEGKEVPIRMPIGSDAWGYIKRTYEATLKTLDDWAGVMKSADIAQ